MRKCVFCGLPCLVLWRDNKDFICEYCGEWQGRIVNER